MIMLTFSQLHSRTSVYLLVLPAAPHMVFKDLSYPSWGVYSTSIPTKEWNLEVNSNASLATSWHTLVGAAFACSWGLCATGWVRGETGVRRPHKGAVQSSICLSVLTQMVPQTSSHISSSLHLFSEPSGSGSWSISGPHKIKKVDLSSYCKNKRQDKNLKWKNFVHIWKLGLQANTGGFQRPVI